MPHNDDAELYDGEKPPASGAAPQPPTSEKRPSKLDALNRAFQCAYIECPAYVIDDIRRLFDEYLAEVLAHAQRYGYYGVAALAAPDTGKRDKTDIPWDVASSPFERWYESYPDTTPYMEGMKDAFEAGVRAALEAAAAPSVAQQQGAK